MCKVVRATMSSMATLLSSDPNIQVIHLMRDPRGVTLSRSKFSDSVRGLYSQASATQADRLVREASMYCTSVVADIKERRILERTYPGRILSVVYDDLVTNIESRVESIYQFLDMPLRDVSAASQLMRVKATVGRIKNDTTNDVTKIAGQWRTDISYEVRMRIQVVC